MSERARGVVFMQLFLGPVLQWDRASAPIGMQLPWGHSPSQHGQHGGAKAATLQLGAGTCPLQWGQPWTGVSAPIMLHTLQPTLTYGWLFIAGADVDLDQVEDNKVIFRFISRLVRGNRLCWLRQALTNLSRHSQVQGRVTPMVGLEKGHTLYTLYTMRAQRTQ